MHCGAYNIHKSKMYDKNNTKARRKEMKCILRRVSYSEVVQYYWKED